MADWIILGVVLVLAAYTVVNLRRRRSILAVSSGQPPYALRTPHAYYIETKFGWLEVRATTVENARRFALREERRMEKENVG